MNPKSSLKESAATKQDSRGDLSFDGEQFESFEVKPSTPEIVDQILAELNLNAVFSHASGDAHCTEETEETKESKETKEIQEAEERGERKEYQEREETNDLSPDIQTRLDEAVHRCGVTIDNNINRSLFNLAREIRGFEEEFGVAHFDHSGEHRSVGL